jgi:Ser/Thr protein kinase RdoA (MazF antagonist)
VTDDYRTYLEDYHAAHVSSEAVLGRMVARATGSPPAGMTRLVEGSNEVYLVTTAVGTECVLKVQLYPGTDLAAEQWAMEQARAAGVPVPEVLCAGEEEGQAFLVETRAAGRPLAALLPTLDAAARAVVWARLGEVLGRLHTVTVGGFWKREEGDWDFADWRSVMDSTVRDRGSERPWVERAGFTAQECDAMARLLVRYRDEFDCPQPFLCHGDFYPEHIFVGDDLSVSAVIDFGDYCGDHPVHDLAALLGVEHVDFPALLRGYPGDWVRTASFEDRLYLHRLTLDMGYLAHFLQHRPGHPEVPTQARALRTTLEWLLARGW